MNTRLLRVWRRRLRDRQSALDLLARVYDALDKRRDSAYRRLNKVRRRYDLQMRLYDNACRWRDEAPGWSEEHAHWAGVASTAMRVALNRSSELAAARKMVRGEPRLRGRFLRILPRLAGQAATREYAAVPPREKPRKARNMKPLPEEVVAPEAEKPAWAVLEEYEHELPDDWKRLLAWRYGLHGQDRMSVGEIAERIGTSTRTVKRMLQVIRTHLREYAAQRYEEQRDFSVWES